MASHGDDGDGRTGYGLNGKLTVTEPHAGMVSGGMGSGPLGHATVYRAVPLESQRLPLTTAVPIGIPETV